MNTPNRSEPDLATFLASFDPDPGIRGRQWEHVCQWFLESDPVYRARLKKVWRWAAWPGQWGPDAGIDLVAEAHDGTVWAIQAKAYAPTTAVTKADMDSFLSESVTVALDQAGPIDPPVSLTVERHRTDDPSVTRYVAMDDTGEAAAIRVRVVRK